MHVQTFGPIPVVTAVGQVIALGDPPIDVDATDPEVGRALADGRLVDVTPETKPAKTAKD